MVPKEPEPTRRTRNGARERARNALMADILRLAREHLDRDGPADLSLRSIARELGMVSSAIYRYIPSRDALLTLLIVDGYGAVGQIVEDAAHGARARGATPALTWLAVARAFRAWAMANRSMFELLYGTPVRGYAAPPDTVDPAVRMWRVIAQIVRDAYVEGSLRPPGPQVPTGILQPAVADIAGPESVDDPQFAQAVLRSVSLFACLLGAVTAEAFGHLRGMARDDDALFDATIATGSLGVGLVVPVKVTSRNS